MSGGNVLNLGDLAKPAEALINRVSDAIGGIARPWQIERIAKAESKAAILRAETDLKLTELQQRALNRLANEEVRKQENIESVTYKALPHLAEDADPTKIDDDWLTDFFEESRKISNEQVQEIWAHILAQEANSPESVPKSTISVLAGIGIRDAKLFSGVLSLSKRIEGHFLPLIYGAADQIVRDQGLDFDHLAHLQDLGLLSFNSMTGFNISGAPAGYRVILEGALHYLDPPEQKLDIGIVRLTFAGRQIAGCAEKTESPGLEGYLRSKWQELGVIIRPADPA